MISDWLKMSSKIRCETFDKVHWTEFSTDWLTDWLTE